MSSASSNPVSQTQRRILTEYLGVHSPADYDEAHRLICSLEMRILNAIDGTFDQRSGIHHQAYKILNEDLKRADFLMELPESGRLSQEMREKVVAFAFARLPQAIFASLRVKGRIKRQVNDVRFSCQTCGQNLVIEAGECGVVIPCPGCGSSLTIPGAT